MPGVPKTFVDRLGLGEVVERRRGAVGVDVADVAGRDAGVVEGELHAGRGAVAPGRRGGDVVGVGGRGRPEDLGVDVGARAAGRARAPRGRAPPALRRHEAVAADVEGPRHPVVDSAVMLAKAAMPTGVIAASAPPPMTTSQRPVATSRAAAAIAWVPAAQAVTMVSHGPVEAARIETSAAPALAIIIGTRKGETRRGPFSRKTPICSCRVSRPPTPVAKMTPAAVGVGAELAGVVERHLGGGHRELGEPVGRAGPLWGRSRPRGRSPPPGARPRAPGCEAVQEGVEADAAARDDADAR